MVELLLIVLLVLLIAQQKKLSGRVTDLEKGLAEARAQLSGSAALVNAQIDETQAAARQEAPDTVPEPDHAVQSLESSTEIPADPGAPADTQQTRTVGTKPRRSRENFESYVGARWPVWIGGIALALGGIFLVRYSIEAGLLGPSARLTLAAIFGLLLIAGGEIVRRRALPKIADLYANAMIPGALTAAGSVTLLGTIFAAYAFYNYVGPGTAFVLLALVSFLTIGLSLLHGQALAGLGLLASLLTPALVANDDPNVEALFVFLGITWLATNAASRLRRWTVVPMIANLGTGLWVLSYAALAQSFDPLPPALTMIAMVGGTIFLWPGVYSKAPAPGWRGLLRRPPLKIVLSLSIVVVLGALSMVASLPLEGTLPLLAFVAVTAALAAVGASRSYGIWAAVAAAGGAVAGTMVVAQSSLEPVLLEPVDGHPAVVATSFYAETLSVLLLGTIFSLLGIAFLRRFRHAEPEGSSVWAFLMGAVPVTLGFISFLNFGNFFLDWTHGLYGVAIGLVLLLVAERLFARPPGDRAAEIDWPANLVVAGSFAGFVLGLHALTNGIVTTILVSVLGFLYLLAARLRPWPALPWMMAAATALVFGRIAWEPTLIGPNSLGRTPFFNALLPGYGIPTALAILAAWMLRHSRDVRVQNVMQALASLSALITIAVLVRHAMNGGQLEGATPSLGEQAIYTLVTIGFSGVLMTLDLKSPSPVFRFGSMIAGVIATVNVLSLHVFALNPFFSGEGTGSLPVVNLLLLGYLLPAIAYGLVAYLARGRRPMPYVAMLAVSAAILAFLWATLSVRRFWQGVNIADWKGFLAGETYTYSVVWLKLGVAVLIMGSRLNAKSLRLASAGLILISVLKVFLIDMSNLEGILRALSFIGLGAVLIGIGLFYQRILGKGGDATVNEEASS